MNLKTIEMKIEMNNEWIAEMKCAISYEALNGNTVEVFEINTELNSLETATALLVTHYEKLEDLEELCSNLQNDLNHETNVDVKASTRGALFEADKEMKELYKEVQMELLTLLGAFSLLLVTAWTVAGSQSFNNTLEKLAKSIF